MTALACFSEVVARKRTSTASKAKHVSPDVDHALGAIERAWREARHKTLDGLTYKGPEVTGIVPVSTWFSWRKGTSTPDYEEICRVARAVGLDVRPSRQGEVFQLPGGLTLTTEMRQLLTTMQGLPKQLQQDILDFAERHGRAWAAANPPEAGAAK